MTSCMACVGGVIDPDAVGVQFCRGHRYATHLLTGNSPLALPG